MLFPVSLYPILNATRQNDNREWLWDVPKKEVVEKPPKGHKHEREKPLREAKIAAALAKQPELIAAYREKRRIKDKATPFDLFTLTTKELKLKARAAAAQGGGKAKK